MKTNLAIEKLIQCLHKKRILAQHQEKLSDNKAKDRSFLAAIKVYSLNAPIFSMNITFRGTAFESSFA